MKKIVAAVALAASLGLGLAACNGNGVNSVTDNRTSSLASDGPSIDVTPDSPSATATSLPAGSYEDGTKVAVSGFKRFVSSDEAWPSDVHAVKFTVTVKNGTDTPMDNQMIMVDCLANGKTAEDVSDTNVDVSGSGHTLPGQSYSYTYACELPLSTSTIQVEVTPENGDNDTASVFIENV